MSDAHRWLHACIGCDCTPKERPLVRLNLKHGGRNLAIWSCLRCLPQLDEKIEGHELFTRRSPQEDRETMRQRLRAGVDRARENAPPSATPTKPAVPAAPAKPKRKRAAAPEEMVAPDPEPEPEAPEGRVFLATLARGLKRPLDQIFQVIEADEISVEGDGALGHVDRKFIDDIKEAVERLEPPKRKRGRPRKS